MSKRYCMSCNFGAESNNGKVPNFCPNCGKSYIDSAVAARPQPVQSPVFAPAVHKAAPQPRGRLNRQVDDEYIEYPDDATTVPQIDEIQCELTVANLRPNRQTGKEVFNSGSPSEAREILGRKITKAPKVSKAQQKQEKEQFKEQFRTQLAKKPRGESQSTEIGG